MKFIDYGDEVLALILAQPNRKTRPRLTATLPFTDVAKAISARESRRNFGRSSRYTLEYTPWFKNAPLATEFRIGLTRLKDETVAVPLWDDAIKVTSAIAIGDTVINKTLNPVRSGAEWIILSADLATYEIVVVDSINDSQITLHSGAANNWPAGTLLYPLLFGKLAERPSLDSRTPQKVEGALKIIEDSSFARKLNPFAGSIPTVGAGIPAFSTMPLWDIAPAWSQVLDTTEADILYQMIGFGRQEQKYVYLNRTGAGSRWNSFADRARRSRKSSASSAIGAARSGRS